MLNENIKAFQTAKGLSQTELAVKLNVVRQTISKWEQGLSVPDADWHSCGDFAHMEEVLNLSSMMSEPKNDSSKIANNHL